MTLALHELDEARRSPRIAVRNARQKLPSRQLPSSDGRGRLQEDPPVHARRADVRVAHADRGQIRRRDVDIQLGQRTARMKPMERDRERDRQRDGEREGERGREGKGSDGHSKARHSAQNRTRPIRIKLYAAHYANNRRSDALEALLARVERPNLAQTPTKIADLRPIRPVSARAAAPVLHRGAVERAISQQVGILRFLRAAHRRLHALQDARAKGGALATPDPVGRKIAPRRQIRLRRPPERSTVAIVCGR
eukprot:scaffold536_cov250-Pinguiococcus_pyrenoidosus.AAC.4